MKITRTPQQPKRINLASRIGISTWDEAEFRVAADAGSVGQPTLNLVAAPRENVGKVASGIRRIRVCESVGVPAVCP
jgi:hypothetical protein